MAPLIAVVDDDPSVRESLSAFLAALGYGVETFESGPELLASGLGSQADCLLLDVRMPGMTGPELHDELARRGHQPPVVYMTSYAFEELGGLGPLHAGCVCLQKPFSEEELLEALDASLRAG